MQQEFKVKTTIQEIEEKQDKNSNRFYKVSISWELGKPRAFYAFSTDFNLKDTTLKMLANSPEKLVNQRVTITYQEVENKEKNGTFCRIKEIEI